MKKIIILISTFCFSGCFMFTQSFDSYKSDLKEKSYIRGYDKKFIDKEFETVNFNKSLKKLDLKQPEFTRPFSVYYTNLVNAEKISTGKSNLQKNKKTLTKIYAKTGVSPEILIAFWGVETNYGTNKGRYDVLSSTASLGYMGRRRAFFEKEFFASLEILKDGNVQRNNFKGSWAGAFGHFQFMPTTFSAYKKSLTGKDKIDIINNFEDAAMSAGNYLKSMSWKKDEPWIQLVVIPNEVLKEDIIDQKMPLSFYNNLGIKNIKGKPLSKSETKAKLLLPSGISGPAFLAYENFDKIYSWNKSTYYALSVSLLAEQIKGKYTDIHLPKEERLEILKIKEVQKKFNKLNLYHGASDGIIGNGMKKAIKTYQGNHKMIIDGYLSQSLYEKIVNE